MSDEEEIQLFYMASCCKPLWAILSHDILRSHMLIISLVKNERLSREGPLENGDFEVRGRGVGPDPCRPYFCCATVFSLLETVTVADEVFESQNVIVT